MIFCGTSSPPPPPHMLFDLVLSLHSWRSTSCIVFGVNFQIMPFQACVPTYRVSEIRLSYFPLLHIQYSNLCSCTHIFEAKLSTDKKTPQLLYETQCTTQCGKRWFILLKFFERQWISRWVGPTKSFLICYFVCNECSTLVILLRNLRSSTDNKCKL